MNNSNSNNEDDNDKAFSYPLPAYLHFCPGGITYAGAKEDQEKHWYTLGSSQSKSQRETLVTQARTADHRLRQYSLFANRDAPHVLPSLSCLAQAAFGPLTGVPTNATKAWADAMVLSHLHHDDVVPASEEDIFRPEAVTKPPAALQDTTATVLARLLKEAQAQQQDVSSPSFRTRPCGYVFQRGDIAWNCRTCQTDATCVVCDQCFRNSDHSGHDVFFHRTTPGGCCDCGDAEAWKLEGCCEEHRPAVQQVKVEINADDPMEAARMASRGLQEGVETLTQAPTALPPRLAAALGVVIGAAVQCMVAAVNGAGIGADPVQWKMRWADEAARVWNGACSNEDYYCRQNPPEKLTSFLNAEEPKNFPPGLSLHLRLHNDDVHTFDEVIEALHEPRSVRRSSTGEDPANQSLVPLREDASDMTHHVDSDGQVQVKTFTNITEAVKGFRRLKSHGLHCAVVSTAQMHLEQRARALSAWLSEISSAHPAVAVLVVQALVQVGEDHDIAGVRVWHKARMIPPWVAMGQSNEMEACRRRFRAFPPHLTLSYLTREEAELLHGIGLTVNTPGFVDLTGTVPGFYSSVPYRIPSERYAKSPHSLWGTLPSLYSDPLPPASKHPLLQRLLSGDMDPSIGGMKNRLTENIYVVDTDLRKAQEADRITSSVYTHRLPGLNMISGVGTIRPADLDARRPPLPSPMDLRHLLATSSFRAPVSPILLLLLLDPYPTKQLRGIIHALFLSLLTDQRFKCRFAGALAIAYRPLSTLFCAGVGTDADTPLLFTVQILTAGSLIRALGSAPGTQKLLLSDREGDQEQGEASIGVFTTPIAHSIVRCIHTNLLGATKEVIMILKNTSPGNDNDSQDDASQQRNDNLVAALTYTAGEHPLLTPLPAAPDDGFLDSRSTRHKRLPHLLRDLEYVIDTPGTAIRLLLPQRFPIYQGPSLSFRGEDVLTFPAVFCRMLRLAQGMDPQKRKISGGHVEYEQNRWLEAFGLSLNFAGVRDALAQSPLNSSAVYAPISEDGSHLLSMREAVGNVLISILREIKFWLYREGMLETGLPVPPGGGPHGAMDMAQVESLQRSTLHVSGSQYASMPVADETSGRNNSNAVALSCATGIKMTETQLSLIETALRVEGAQRMSGYSSQGLGTPPVSSSGAVMGDWLRVPHSPLAGDSLSFHLPLHRAFAMCIQSICSVLVPETVRASNPNRWWMLPGLDEQSDPSASGSNHPLVTLIRSTLRSSNCRVVWTDGPDCSPQEAQRRRSRSRNVSAYIAVAKVIYSLADHPIRCIAAAQQIERHLWARNGSSVAGMAVNYSSTPLCRSFRDLDLFLVQLSASGMSIGLGARRTFALLLSRFSMDGYLCDPERRTPSSSSSPSSGAGAFGSNVGGWVNPPRFQDPDHAVVLSESLFSTLCVLVSELPPPPPVTLRDDSSLKQSIKRELIHALAAEPRSHSEALAAASCGLTRREEIEGSSGTTGSGALFRKAFAEVLDEVGKKKTGSSRASTGPPSFELNPEFCDEYDPTFFHLRRQEHQHAMDIVARMRKQKWGNDSEATESYCLPLVCAPPAAHPRFLSSRLLLHLQSMDAAIRRSLLFALTGGSWLPPSEPFQRSESGGEEDAAAPDASDMVGVSTIPTSSPSGEVPLTTIPRGLLRHSSSSSASFLKRSAGDNASSPPFSQEVVAASSISFLEVLQLLTLQVHTLEDCASLHRTMPDLDEESKSLSAGLSINSYLGRLVGVPETLVDVWALRPFPDGPLKSAGSGENRGSILGLLIALYEHRADHGPVLDSDGADYGQADGGHGGARTLASSGLKWLLRFVHALVEGAPSVGMAIKSATTGVPFRHSVPSSPKTGGSGFPSWTIDETVRSTIRGMLTDLPELWPKPREMSVSVEKTGDKSKEAGKAAQLRAREMIMQKQAAFAATIAPSDDATANKEADTESELCIICRCDDVDGENNGPLGYLAHVQRSRVAQMRATTEGSDPALSQTYRVVGHMGCQLRETQEMDSKALQCLPRGSVVTVLESKVSMEYDILARRVLVRHATKDPNTKEELVTEGWASIQSSQGYVILSPLVAHCYSNTRWGNTRPIIKQCGHAAHLKCVETHTLSLHQRAAGEQPYDGRFAANIADGEFLCPLCKQLSNMLIPCDRYASNQEAQSSMDVDDPKHGAVERTPRQMLTGVKFAQSRIDNLSEFGRAALEDFGSHLYQGMTVPWERATASRKQKQQHWNPSIQKWDFEDDDDDDEPPFSVRSVLRLLRQQLIAWAAVGHSAAASEAGARGIEEVLPFGVMSQTSDPWSGIAQKSRDSHPMLLELKRTLTGASGLLEIICIDLANELAMTEQKATETSVVSTCLADIVEGISWILSIEAARSRESVSRLALWSELTALGASVPCHVSRDGELSQRSEARATAAAMWTVKGLGTDHRIQDKIHGEPPAPFAIAKLFSSGTSGLPPIPKHWGTMNPFTSGSETDDLKPRVPFRPALASAFLYTPLLAWDLNTLAGAVISSLLVNDVKDLPTSAELLLVARTLLIGRMIQVVVTPGGVVIPDEMELDEEDCWNDGEIQTEGAALVKLVAHCRAMVKTKSLKVSNQVMGDVGDLVGSTLLAGVGRAFLPFARALILMLRACTAVIRERRQKSGLPTTEVTPASDCLDAALFGPDTMQVEDGFHILKALQGPVPSRLIDVSDEWWSLLNRWLVSAIGLEVHSGSRGRSLVPTIMPNVSLDTESPSPSAASMPQSESEGSDVKRPRHGVPLHLGMDSMETEGPQPPVDDSDFGIQIEIARNAPNNAFDQAMDSDEELGEEMEMDDEAEEIIGFANQMLGGQVFGHSAAANDDMGESSDDNSSQGSEVGAESDREFAHVSRAPIIPFQPSLLAVEEIGAGRSGSALELAKASAVMADLSHLGLIHRKETPTFSLVRLPKSFVELYNIVNRIKGRDDGAEGNGGSDDHANAETAICLLTGAVMKSGSSRRSFSRAARPPGACTLHARKNGSGIGMFFLVQKCTVLLMHNNKSAYAPSLYVDEHGEEDPGLRRGRPLFLNQDRYRALELLWRQQLIPREVAQIRSTSDRVIRDNWY